ncbi:DUF1858 domain-containing protein [bacterium]|nr:DUF1858 domain-containing protein [bacterium]
MKEPLSPDMTVGRLLEEHPELTAIVEEILSANCQNCPAAHNETLRLSAMLHGAELNELLRRLETARR